jgi:hypothetical protein
LVADDPKKRRVIRRIDDMSTPIDGECGHDPSLVSERFLIDRTQAPPADRDRLSADDDISNTDHENTT